MIDRSGKIVLSLCTLLAAVNLWVMVVDAAPIRHIGLAVILVSMVGSATLCAFIFPEHPPGAAPGDSPAADKDGVGPYNVAVSWYDEAGPCWRFHASWTGLADSGDDAVAKAIADTRELHDELLRGEITTTPDAFEGTMDRRECEDVGAHGTRLDADRACVYCGYQAAN